MSDISFLLVTLIGLLVLLAAKAYYSYLSERTRTQALSQVAEELGFAFYPNGDKAFLLNLLRLHLFSQGHYGRLTNLMQGTFKNTGVAIFDYRYVTGSGRYKHTWY
jgi:hypothetical protein